MEQFSRGTKLDKSTIPFMRRELNRQNREKKPPLTVRTSSGEIIRLQT